MCHTSCLQCIGSTENDCSACNATNVINYEDPINENELLVKFKCILEDTYCSNSSYVHVRAVDNSNNKN